MVLPVLRRGLSRTVDKAGLVVLWSSLHLLFVAQQQRGLSPPSDAFPPESYRKMN